MTDDIDIAQLLDALEAAKGAGRYMEIQRDQMRREHDSMRSELEQARKELADARNRVLKPLTEEQIRDALAEGRAESRMAQGNNAWTAIVNQRDALRHQLEQARTEADAWEKVARERHATLEAVTRERDEARRASDERGGAGFERRVESATETATAEAIAAWLDERARLLNGAANPYRASENEVFDAMADAAQGFAEEIRAGSWRAKEGK